MPQVQHAPGQEGQITAVFLQPIDPIVIAWLALCLLCTGYVAYDQLRHNPEAPVMKWGFVPSLRSWAGNCTFLYHSIDR